MTTCAVVLTDCAAMVVTNYTAAAPCCCLPFNAGALLQARSIKTQMAARTMLFAAQSHIKSMRQKGRINSNEAEALEKVRALLTLRWSSRWLRMAFEMRRPGRRQIDCHRHLPLARTQV